MQRSQTDGSSMKSKRKNFAAFLGILILSFASVFPMDVKAGNVLDEGTGGIGSLLEPGSRNTSEIIDATARALNLNLETKEEVSKLVMANVSRALNVRTDASADSKRLGLLYKDCGGTIIERKDGWTKIRSGNLEGWAYDDYLLFGDDAKELASEVGKLIATVNSNALRVHASADAASDTLGCIAKGELVDVIDDSDENWVCIEYDGEEGYVSRAYVTLDFKIDAGATNEEIKAREKAEAEEKRHVNYGEYTTDADTLKLLAALIQCEAGGEPYEGQVAVGAVVMNRVRSSAYPNTIHAVIYASGQFTPAMSGKVNRVYESGNIYESCIKAAQEALDGVSNVGDLTHFRRNDGRDGLVIGHHVFY